MHLLILFGLIISSSCYLPRFIKHTGVRRVGINGCSNNIIDFEAQLGTQRVKRSYIYSSLGPLYTI